MSIVCVGAVLAGGIAATVLPFLPFACAVLTAIVLGTLSMVIEGAQIGQTCVSATIVLAASQVGYGLGLFITAMIGQGLAVVRRSGTSTEAQPVGPPLRTGKEPRSSAPATQARRVGREPGSFSSGS